MKTRILSALIALPLLFFVLLSGGTALYIGAFILSIVGLYEFFRVFSKEYKPVSVTAYGMTVLWFVGLYIGIMNEYFMFLIAVFVFVLLAVLVFTKRAVIDILIPFLAFFYIPFSLSHLMLISAIDANFFIWYPFIIAFITDTFAYFVGRLIGKTPLIPSVSPNKTVEGSIGGVIACVGASYTFAMMFNPGFSVFAVFLGFFGSMFSQVGDLIASKIKRIFKIKDFGNIMPGHGGVLDRFDSLIVTMPLVYYFIVLFEYVQALI